MDQRLREPTWRFDVPASLVVFMVALPLCIAIAQASGNTRIAELLELLGHHIIPRQSVRMSLVTPATAQRLYLTRIQEEHGRIFQAICGADPAEARRAMRAHLTRSLSRYRRLAERPPAPDTRPSRRSQPPHGRT